MTNFCFEHSILNDITLLVKLVIANGLKISLNIREFSEVLAELRELPAELDYSAVPGTT